MKSKRILIALLLLTAIIVYGCSKSSEEAAEPEKPKQELPPTFTTEIKDGVTFVHNTGMAWGESTPVRLESLEIIGESEDERLNFFKPTDFTIGAEGNLYVLDSGNHRIQKLDPDGRFLASFGKAGQGPGEFQFPICIDLDATGNVYVNDKGPSNMKILDPEGKELRSLNWKGIAGYFMLLSTGKIVLKPSTGQFRYSETGDLMYAYDLDGNRGCGYGIEEMHEEFDPYRYFNSISFTLDKEDSVYIAYGSRNKIEKYRSSGEHLMTIDRPINFEVSSEITYEKFDMGPRKIDIPRVNSVSASLDVDEKGRIWVLSYERQLKLEELGLTIQFMDGDGRYEGSENLQSVDTHKSDAFAFHVFNREGHLLGKIPIQHHAGIVKIYQDRLYILETRHGMVIHSHRIVE